MLMLQLFVLSRFCAFSSFFFPCSHRECRTCRACRVCLGRLGPGPPISWGESCIARYKKSLWTQRRTTVGLGEGNLPRLSGLVAPLPAQPGTRGLFTRDSAVLHLCTNWFFMRYDE